MIYLCYFMLGIIALLIPVLIWMIATDDVGFHGL